MDDTAIETSLGTSQEKAPTKRPGDKVDETPQPKKIVLNRKVVEAPDPLLQEPTIPEPTKEATTAPKVVAKIGNLSMNERLAKRKARFSDSSATAPIIKASVVTESVSVPQISPKATIDVLKKRAERFGAVAPVLEKVCLW